MTSTTLLLRSLTHFWRINLAVVAGVGVAVSVLAGALLVGTSVRASLRDLALERLGRVDHVVTAGAFFREALAGELLAAGALAGADAGTAPTAAPMIALEGFVIHQESRGRAGGIQVYGVDDRFWAFHGRGGERRPAPGEVLVSGGLARELGAGEGDTLLVRVQKPSAIPVSSLHGRRDDLGRSMRLRIGAVLAPAELGEFSFRPRQGFSRAVFVHLARMQRDLEVDRKANTLLLAGVAADAAGASAVARIEAALRGAARLSDLGLRVRALPGPAALAVESTAGLLDDDVVDAASAAAAAAGMAGQPVLTYLANAIRRGERSVPWSLVTALDPAALGVEPPAAGGPPPIWLNAWTAADLEAAPGDAVTLEYYRWEDAGALVTETADFRVAGVVPMEGLAVDRDLAPEYPGITEATDLTDWDPPFPIDLGLVRPRDEDYWDRYRTASKGFVALEDGRRRWGSRWGQATSLRVFPPDGAPDLAAAEFGDALRSRLDPLAAGFVVYPARELALEASAGVTDFGEYFTYFSFFLVVSALLLASLFFRLGVEQRLIEARQGPGPSRRRRRPTPAGSRLHRAVPDVLLRSRGEADEPGVRVLVPRVHRHQPAVRRLPIDHRRRVQRPHREHLHEVQVVAGLAHDDVRRAVGTDDRGRRAVGVDLLEAQRQRSGIGAGLGVAAGPVGGRDHRERAVETGDVGQPALRGRARARGERGEEHDGGRAGSGARHGSSGWGTLPGIL